MRLLWRIVWWLGLPLLVAFLVVKWRVAATLDSWIEDARPFAEVSRGSSFVDFNGDVGAETVSVFPQSGDAGTLRAARVTLHTPGFFWLLRGGSDELPSTFGVSIDGLDTSAMTLGRDQPSLIGEQSAALFDHAGCQDAAFTDGELGGLGLPAQPTRISLRYTLSDSGALLVDMSAQREGSSTSSFQMRFTVPGGPRADAASALGATFDGARAEFTDGGFLSARNAACSQRAKVAPSTFLEQHVDAAKVLARRLGIAPDAAWWASYASFVQQGGRLTLEATPRAPLSVMALQGLQSPREMFLSWQVRRDGETPQAVQIELFKPSAADSGQPLTLTQQIEAEMRAERERQAQSTRTETAKSAEMAATRPLGSPAGRAANNDPRWRELTYADLADRIGAEVRVETRIGTVRTGVLERWNPAGMVLRLSPRDGSIPLSMTPNDARRITVWTPDELAPPK